VGVAHAAHGVAEPPRKIGDQISAERAVPAPGAHEIGEDEVPLLDDVVGLDGRVGPGSVAGAERTANPVVEARQIGGVEGVQRVTIALYGALTEPSELTIDFRWNGSVGWERRREGCRAGL
jgi:hypothetical protein